MILDRDDCSNAITLAVPTMKKKKLKLLVTSVGSLVASNLIDVLEHEPFRRRDLVHLIGTNSIAGVPNNFRCDRCYLVPETRSETFRGRLAAIIAEEQPDLILVGRDADTEVVAQLMESSAFLARQSPCGRFDAVRCALNKWESWQFALRHALPFADSFVVGKSGDFSELEKFSQKVGFPMIAKPIEGSASKGVYYVRDLDDARRLAALDYIFQEYLGCPETLYAYFECFQPGIPLFAVAPTLPLFLPYVD